MSMMKDEPFIFLFFLFLFLCFFLGGRRVLCGLGEVYVNLWDFLGSCGKTLPSLSCLRIVMLCVLFVGLSALSRSYTRVCETCTRLTWTLNSRVEDVKLAVDNCFSVKGVCFNGILICKTKN